ncbi:MAG: type II secretion system protein [Desulfobacterales bacterium]|nr:type II secretion system protein [Desulfobacterales bacterium]
MKNYYRDGFTLIELMIVILIIGLLASIALPNFLLYQCRSKQSEAQINLGAIGACQAAYFAEFDIYSDNSTAIGFAPTQHNRYNYTVGQRQITYTATAQANQPSLNNDTWTYSHQRKLVNTINGCS